MAAITQFALSAYEGQRRPARRGHVPGDPPHAPSPSSSVIPGTDQWPAAPGQAAR